MRKTAGLALIVFAITGLVIAQAGPAFAAQTIAGINNAESAVDHVVGTQGQVPVQLVRGGHMGVHGRVGAWRGVRFNNFRLNNFGHFRHFRPFAYSYYPYYSYPYYSYSNNCYWDGYSWICNDYTY
jgi:hypothetical protein